MKRYLEDNFKHRQDLVKPDEKLSNSNREYVSEDERPIHHSGIGPRTKDGKHRFKVGRLYCHKAFPVQRVSIKYYKFDK